MSGFTNMHDAGDGLSGETVARNDELEWTGGDASEGEAAVVGGDGLLIGGAVLTRELDLRSDDRHAGGVDHRTGEGVSRGLGRCSGRFRRGGGERLVGRSVTGSRGLREDRDGAGEQEEIEAK